MARCSLTLSPDEYRVQPSDLAEDLEDVDLFLDPEMDPYKLMELEAKMLSRDQRSSQKEKQIKSVFGEIVGDCQELMHHFGVPYVMAPYEAESQCAYLQSRGEHNRPEIE